MTMNCEHSRTALGFLYALPRLLPHRMWEGFRVAKAYAEEKGVYHGPLQKAFEYYLNEWLLKRTPEVVSVYNEEYTATQGMESKNFELNRKVSKHPPYWDCYRKYCTSMNFTLLPWPSLFTSYYNLL